MLSDFNLYYLAQGSDNILRNIGAKDLLDLIEIAGLDNQVISGTIIYDQASSQSIINLVLILYSLREQIIVYKVNNSVYTNSDYLLILTLLKVNVLEAIDPIKQRNQKVIDVEKFLIFALANLSTIQLLKEPIPRKIEYAVDYLIDII